MGWSRALRCSLGWADVHKVGTLKLELHTILHIILSTCGPKRLL